MDHNEKDALVKALEYLNMEEQLEALNIRRESRAEGNYFVAFIGQFSAGKSYLINNLLQRDLLTSGSKETTPVLTYIRYGEQECGVLHYSSGTAQQITIEEIQTVIQDNAGIDYSHLEYLEVYLNEAYLQGGMVLIDTPGVNTVIERHERLLSRSMELASKIFYVTGNSPSRIDVEKLTALRKAGFSPCFVRTHCDEIKASEESPEEAIAKDLAILSPLGLTREDCFFVSNHSDSAWFERIEPLRQMIIGLGQNAQEELDSSVREWERWLSEICLEMLRKKKEDLISLKAGEDGELQERLEAVQERIAGFEQMVARRQNRLKKEISECQSELQGPVRQELTASLMKIQNRIGASGVRTAEQMGQLLAQETMQFAVRTNERIDAAVMPILHGVQDAQRSSYTYRISAAPEMERYSELESEENEQLQRIQSKLNEIQQNRKLLEEAVAARENTPEMKEILDNLRELEEEIGRIQEQSNELPPYQPQYVEVEDGRLQPSQVASAIGGALDWAFLLLPGASVSAALMGAANSAGIVTKGARILGKAEKLIKAADTGKDIAYTARGIKAKFEQLGEKRRRTYATKRRQETVKVGLEQAANGVKAVETGVGNLKQSGASFLDYLTIQHWTTELGKKFDRLPRMELDQEYERSYREKKNELALRMTDAQRRRYQKNCELRVYGSETERLEAEKKAAIADEAELNRQLSREREKIRVQAEERARKKWASQCGKWFYSQCKQQLDSMIKECSDSLPARLSAYQERVLGHTRENLQREMAEYKRLCSLPKSEAEQELNYVTELITDLNDMASGVAG